jgi:hypothetical protein
MFRRAPWSCRRPLVHPDLREAYYGVKRFDEFEYYIGSSQYLEPRLKKLMMPASHGAVGPNTPGDTNTF